MSCSALILAGGRGSRLGFREKALIDINGKPLIAYVIEKLEKVVDEIIISVRNETQGELLKAIFPNLRYAYDMYENTGPLAGILSGLTICKDEFCFIAACDMPFINEKVVNFLFSKCKDYEAAIPLHGDGFLEPLHAVYNRSAMLSETKKSLENRETTILAPISRLHVNYMPFEELSKIDPDLTTFMNINTCEDIEKVES
ncbi:MAG: molybdenum cofactor guanylyltransferase [Candidatus Methanoperedens sp.]|nr:molybdenum cofactor guanylyltransferase [Candidatus Methanoperedens sp.]